LVQMIQTKSITIPIPIVMILEMILIKFDVITCCTQCKIKINYLLIFNLSFFYPINHYIPLPFDHHYHKSNLNNNTIQ
jgi:hypothetical protein